MTSSGIVTRLREAHKDAGLPPPEDHWVECLKLPEPRGYFHRRLTGYYVETVERLTTLQRECDELTDLKERVELAETLLANGVAPDTVARQLRLRPDQIADIQADEPVQWRLEPERPKARCIRV